MRTSVLWAATVIFVATGFAADFDEDRARSEAYASLPPPLAAVRLDKPELVFSNADPLVAEGVRQWLATLDGPHDQYGNYKGAGYRGSFRPDSVNKALVEFLAKFLAGKRLVALSDAQQVAVIAQQEFERTARVEAIVRERRAEASQAAAPPSTGPTSTATSPTSEPPTGSTTVAAGGGSPKPENVPDLGRGNDSGSSQPPAPPPPPSPPPPPEPPARVYTFADDVMPVLQVRCGACHGNESRLPRLASTNAGTAYEAVRPRVDVNDPASSLLLRKGTDTPSGSHGGKEKLGGRTSDGSKILLAWIQAGARKD